MDEATASDNSRVCAVLVTYSKGNNTSIHLLFLLSAAKSFLKEWNPYLKG